MCARRCRSEPGRGRPSGEAGFTFVEIIVAMALASILGLAVLGGLHSGQNLIGRAARDAAWTARVAQLEAVVRRSARLVRIPYWVREVAVEQGEGWLSIPYYRGEAADRLVLRSREKRLLIGEAYLGPFAGLTFGLESGTDGRPWGLRVSVEDEAVRGMTIVARFGSTSGL